MLWACSVKEERKACPGWLEIGLDECRTMTQSVQLAGWNREGQVFSQREPVGLSGDSPPVFSVPKGTVCYRAYFGVLDSDLQDGNLAIPEGSHMKPLYSYVSRELTVGDYTIHDDVRPSKQFCDVQVLLSDELKPRFSRLMGVMTSSTGLVRMDDFTVGKGRFAVSETPDSLAGMTFRVPRQGFDDLTLTLYESGRILREFNLSSWLLSAGYDWQAESLADVMVRLGAEEVSSGLIIDDWTDGGETLEQI